MTRITRITPTARLVLHADAPREDWLAVRRQGITATDLPAILGLNKYKTAIDVWTDKVLDQGNTFNPKIGDGEAALWGTVLEDSVARTWADHKNLAVRRIGIIAHLEFPWAMASLDRLVTGCPDGRCALEVKTRSLHAGAEWDNEVPADVKAQVDWQLLVSGLDHIHVIALIGGQRLIEHQLWRADVDLDRLLDSAELVWTSVLKGVAPDLPPALWTDAYLEQKHPQHEGATEVNAITKATLTEYQKTCDQIKELETYKADLRTQLVGALADFETALFDGTPVYSYKPTSRKSLDSKTLAQLYPDVVSDERIWNTSTTHTLRVSTTKESK